MSIANQVIQEWAIDYKSKLPDHTRRLIRLAQHDLYFGPINPEELDDEDQQIWTSFNSACTEIYNSLSELSDVWVDVQTEEVMEEEPQGYFDEELDEYVEPEWSDIYKFDRDDLIKLIVGRELSTYIS